MNKIKFGYSFWGWQGDYRIQNSVEVSAPDSCGTYAWCILQEAQNRGWETYQMLPDRDDEAVEKYGVNHFKSFSTQKRWNAYKNSKKVSFWDYKNGGVKYKWPELDILLLEWRFPIPGRNCDYDNDDKKLIFDNPKYQPDFYLQIEMLEHYKNTNTKIIIMDLDQKLTTEEEKKWLPDAILEPAILPKHQYIHRTSFEFPFDFDEINQFEFLIPDDNKELVYIGSRYERDIVIDRYIKQYAKNRPNKVYFYGNWLDYPEKHKEALERWPGISFNRRIGYGDFRDVYKDAVAVPLLAKVEYFKHGFTTARFIESLLFGSIPIGFNEQNGSHKKFFINVNDSYELMREVDALKDFEYRKHVRREQIEMMYNKHNVINFIDKLEDYL